MIYGNYSIHVPGDASFTVLNEVLTQDCIHMMKWLNTRVRYDNGAYEDFGGRSGHRRLG